MSIQNCYTPTMGFLVRCSKLNKLCRAMTCNFRTNSYDFGSQPSPFRANTRVVCCKSVNYFSANFRPYCTEDRVGPQFPNLMNFPVFIWPNIFKSMKNWILANFIISKYFDTQFSINEFTTGSKKAVEVVSRNLAKGDLNGLSGLVSPEAITELKQHLYSFTLRQQSELAIFQEDIFLCFPYEIGIIFEEKDGDSPQKRYVEITMCYHILSGLKEMKENKEPPPINFGTIPEYQQKMFIANYRFFRDFTEGVEPRWIINALNHLKPVNDVQ